MSRTPLMQMLTQNYMVRIIWITWTKLMTQKIRRKVTFGLVSYRIWTCLTFQETLKRPDIFSKRQCCIKLKHFPYRKIPIFQRIPRYTVHTMYVRLESWNEYLSSANIIPVWPIVAFTRAISFKYNLWLFNILWFLVRMILNDETNRIIRFR